MDGNHPYREAPHSVAPATSLPLERVAQRSAFLAVMWSAAGALVFALGLLVLRDPDHRIAGAALAGLAIPLGGLALVRLLALRALLAAVLPAVIARNAAPCGCGNHKGSR